MNAHENQVDPPVHHHHLDDQNNSHNRAHRVMPVLRARWARRGSLASAAVITHEDNGAPVGSATCEMLFTDCLCPCGSDNWHWHWQAAVLCDVWPAEF